MPLVPSYLPMMTPAASQGASPLFSAMAEEGVAVGRFVYVTGYDRTPIVGLSVNTDSATLPSAGVVTQLLSDGTCLVQTAGIADIGGELAVGAEYYVGPNGEPATIDSVGLGMRYVQSGGIALSPTQLLLRMATQVIYLELQG